MILTYHCVFGKPLSLDITERFGQSVELEGFEFVNALPIEWRLVSETESCSEWLPPTSERKALPFHDLQIARRGGGTRGTPAAGLSLETRGIGECVLLVWPREGTYSEVREVLTTIILRCLQTTHYKGYNVCRSRQRLALEVQYANHRADPKYRSAETQNLRILAIALDCRTAYRRLGAQRSCLFICCSFQGSSNR